MGQPKSPTAYPHAREALERALSSPKGVKITFDTAAQAIRFRFACYTVRDRARRQSVKIYKPGDAEYGRSPFDHFSIIVEHNVVRIELPTLNSTQIEELP